MNRLTYETKVVTFRVCCQQTDKCFKNIKNSTSGLYFYAKITHLHRVIFFVCFKYGSGFRTVVAVHHSVDGRVLTVVMSSDWMAMRIVDTFGPVQITLWIKIVNATAHASHTKTDGNDQANDSCA